MSRHGSLSSWKVALCALVTLFLPLAAAAQTGRLAGTVKDAQGKAMRAATVVAGNPDAAPPVRAAVTDDKGRFAIAGLRSGMWIVTASATGYLAASSAVRVSGVIPNTKFNVTLERDPEYRPPAMEGVDVGDLQQRLAAADSLLGQARYAEAIEAYLALIARVPALTSLQLQIGRAHRGAREYDEAAEAYRRALEGGIGGEIVLPELALVRLDEGNVAGAKEALERLRGVEATTGGALYARALVAAREGDRASARTLLEQFLAAEPDAPEATSARRLLDEMRY